MPAQHIHPFAASLAAARASSCAAGHYQRHGAIRCSRTPILVGSGVEDAKVCPRCDTHLTPVGTGCARHLGTCRG